MGPADSTHEVDDGHDHHARRCDLHAQRYRPPLSAPTTPAPAATTTSRNVPQASEKSRRHSWADSKKSGGAEAWSIRCSSVDPVCSYCAGVMINPLCSDNFARDHGILIKLVNRAEPVITIGDNQLAVRFVPVQ